MADYLATNLLPVDVVVPVPLHRRRERDRGFNQSALLARAVATACALPTNEASLMRTRETVPQVGLDIYARRVNVRGAFRAGREGVVGRRVLLIDDVCTTGATMEACAEALAAVGARAVWGFALARGQ
jgi:ComF family protein